MTAKEMVELVQQHHPHLGETECIKLLNRVKDDFCEESEIYKKTDSSLTTAANQRWYTIPSDNSTGIHLVKIEEVYLNDVRIPRLQGNPIINDES
jgi:hypothetical protein